MIHLISAHFHYQTWLHPLTCVYACAAIAVESCQIDDVKSVTLQPRNVIPLLASRYNVLYCIDCDIIGGNAAVKRSPSQSYGCFIN